MIPGLTPGRIAHYVLDDTTRRGDHRAAIITECPGSNGQSGPIEGNVALTVFLGPGDDMVGVVPGVLLVVESAPYSESHEPGTWHWPERT